MLTECSLQAGTWSSAPAHRVVVRVTGIRVGESLRTASSIKSVSRER